MIIDESFRAVGKRALVVAVFALVGGVLAWRSQYALHAGGGDHLVIWQAVRDLANGRNPYRNGFIYPLPGLLLAAPFAWLPVDAAAVAFVVGSATLLGIAITRDRFARVPLVFSVCFLASAQLAQSSMAVLAFALIPSLGWLVVTKPNIGLALFAWRPSRSAVIGGAILLLVSVLILPTWPRDWLTFALRLHAHHAPLTVGLGATGLFAAFRWRRAEARLLLAMTMLPHGLYFYDELPLWLIATTRQESIVLAATSWVAWIASLALTDGSRTSAAPFVTLLYPIAAIIILRRPNVWKFETEQIPL